MKHNAAALCPGGRPAAGGAPPGEGAPRGDPAVVDGRPPFGQDPAMRSILSTAAALGVAVLAAGCGRSTTQATSIFSAPEALSELSEETFFDHPWPSDLRRREGKTRFLGYYNPKGVPIITQYIESIDGRLDGFSPAAAGFLRFDNPIDTSSLPPDPAAGLDPGASVQLIDVDVSSPEHGRRMLVSLRFREQEGVYWRPNTLAFMPVPGFPLRPKTRYALVVTDALRSADGTRVRRDPVLDEVLGLSPPTDRTARAREIFAPALLQLELGGIARDHIVHFTTFTTNDPTEELFEVAGDVKSNVPAPEVAPGSWEYVSSSAAYDTYVGVYGPSPNYQAGKLPFKAYGDGGGFNMPGGAPAVVDLFNMRFALSVPRGESCPMPEGGFPIVLYAHGTGGNYKSYIGDGTARELGQRCIASMGVDQIFHGDRPGSPGAATEGSVEILFFNVENPPAARTNPRQGAVDEVQRARLFTESHITVPATVSRSGAEIRFDGTKVLYFGHSQGGLSGPLFLASDATTRGGVLSGSAAVFGFALTQKTKPSPSVKSLVTNVFLSLSAEEAEFEEVDLFHPAIAMAQSIVDVTDPIHYARFLQSEPRAGFAPKSIYMTEGINPDGVGDSYSPPDGIEAHSLAVGLPLQLPGERAIASSAWGGPQPVNVPVEGLSGNLANGLASGVLAQWPISPGDDGHFVVFDQPKAADQAAEFLNNLASDPKGRVPAP